jgi:hypothetical protein
LEESKCLLGHSYVGDDVEMFWPQPIYLEMLIDSHGFPRSSVFAIPKPGQQKSYRLPEQAP